MRTKHFVHCKSKGRSKSKVLREERALDGSPGRCGTGQDEGAVKVYTKPPCPAAHPACSCLGEQQHFQRARGICQPCIDTQPQLETLK